MSDIVKLTQFTWHWTHFNHVDKWWAPPNSEQYPPIIHEILLILDEVNKVDDFRCFTKQVGWKRST